MISMFEQFITFVGNSYPTYKSIYAMIGTVFTIMLFYKKFYKYMGILLQESLSLPSRTINMLFDTARNEDVGNCQFIRQHS